MTPTTTAPKTCRKCRNNKYLLKAHKGLLRAGLCSCFHCDQCDGEGRVFQQNDRGIASLTDCSFCAVLRKRLRFLNASGIPGKFANCSLESYKPVGNQNKKALSRAKDFINDVKARPEEPHKGLLFMGGPGQGKTHLVVSILKQFILEEELEGKFVDFFQLLSDIRNAYSEDHSEMSVIEPYLNSRLLVIDELAKGRNNEWELTMLDQFISSRYNAANRITLFTTNYFGQLDEANEENKTNLVDTSKKEYANSYKKQSLREKIGDRIFSRITEMCTFIRMEGEDYRPYTEPSRDHRGYYRQKNLQLPDIKNP